MNSHNLALKIQIVLVFVIIIQAVTVKNVLMIIKRWMQHAGLEINVWEQTIKGRVV